ncbi:MAG: CRTAC1 family protein, partial [Phycisphaerales bacterium]|nr:CRTAC1 family protein [Phycisphaerales bacterium]
GQLFINRGVTAPCFLELPPQSIGDLATPRVGRGLSYADFDQDGDLDLVLAQVAGPVALLRNDQALQHHWLRIDLRGRPPNTSAIGAEVEIDCGGVIQRRTVSATRSYLSQSELTVTFGLGRATSIERLQIRWPDGTTAVITVPNVDQRISITQ